MPQRKRIKPDERLSFKLMKREHDIILDRPFVDPQLQRRLRFAVTSGSKLVINLMLDDIDELAGSVAAEANHCDDPKIQRIFDAVYDRLAKLEANYTDDQSQVRAPGRSQTLAATNSTGKQGQYLGVHLLLQLLYALT
jgi:hypothetical protein